MTQEEDKKMSIHVEVLDISLGGYFSTGSTPATLKSALQVIAEVETSNT